MTTELLAPPEINIQTVMQQGIFPFWEIHDTGIRLSEDCPENDWQNLATTTADAFQATGESHCRMMAKLCDVLNFGFNKYGERASNIINATAGYMKRSAADLEKAMGVFLRIPEENRRLDELTVDHHKLVAPLPSEEQREFLDKAIDEGWSIKSLKEAIAERHPKNKATPTQTTIRDPDAPKITEGEALEALVKLVEFFDIEEEEHGNVAKWSEPKKVPFRPLMKKAAAYARKIAATPR